MKSTALSLMLFVGLAFGNLFAQEPVHAAPIAQNAETRGDETAQPAQSIPTEKATETSCAKEHKKEKKQKQKKEKKPDQQPEPDNSYLF